MKKIILIVFAAILLLGAAAGAYFVFIKKPPAQQIVNETNATVPNETTDIPQAPSQDAPKGPATILDILPLPDVPAPENPPPPAEPAHLYVNISTWGKSELLAAYSAQLPEINLLTNGIRYLNESNYVYDSARNKTVFKDSFGIIRSKYTAGVLEYPSGLRIGVPNTAMSFASEISQKKDDSRMKLLYPDVYIEWNSISCEAIRVCRDIKAFQCDAHGDTLFIWTPQDAEAQRVWQFPFTMQSYSYDDLRAFERFYCEPI